MGVEKSLDVKNFITLLRRTRTSTMNGASYQEMACINNMLMNCYDAEDDNDFGQHTIIHVPNNLEDFYTGKIILPVAKILKEYTDMTKDLKEFRDKHKLPPKSQRVEMSYERGPNGIMFNMDFYVYKYEKKEIKTYEIKHYKTKKDALIEKCKIKDVRTEELYHKRKSYLFEYVNDDSPIISNILKVYGNMIEYISDDPIIIDCMEDDIYNKVCNTVGFYFLEIDYNGDTLYAPLIKSMFRGITKMDNLQLSVIKTNMANIYVEVLQMESKGIIEQHINYFRNVDIGDLLIRQ